MKISFIVAVYNLEKYIGKCLDSIVRQKYNNIEILVINDGSTDNSLNIIKKYEKKYSNIKIIDKKNGGISTVRNYGLSKATGDLICFIDGDDYIDEDLCNIIIPLFKENNYDMVMFNYKLAYQNGINKDFKILEGKSRVINNSEYILSTPSSWNKVIKTSFLRKNKFLFPENMIYEDLAAIPVLAKYNPKVYYLDKYLYYYVQSDNSITRNKVYKEKYEDIFKATDILYNQLKNTEYFKELEYISTYHLLYLASLNFYNFSKYKNINQISKIMKEYFPNWRKNQFVKDNFTLKEKVYLNLFYMKKYNVIKLYRRIFNHEK